MCSSIRIIMWDLAITFKTQCGQRHTINYIVDSYPLTKLKSSFLSLSLHEADDPIK